MRTLGTVDDWLKLKSEVYLTNRKYMQKGVTLYDLRKLDKPMTCTYPSSQPDGDPMIYFGNQCPYMQKGEFNYTCQTLFYPCGSGGSMVLSDSMAEDPNWYEYNVEDYLKGE